MRREKTVVEVDLSEDQKNEVYLQLVQDQANLNRKMDDEHRRHEDQVKMGNLSPFFYRLSLLCMYKCKMLLCG